MMSVRLKDVLEAVLKECGFTDTMDAWIETFSKAGLGAGTSATILHSYATNCPEEFRSLFGPAVVTHGLFIARLKSSATASIAATSEPAVSGENTPSGF